MSDETAMLLLATLGVVANDVAILANWEQKLCDEVTELVRKAHAELEAGDE
jgi:hypothetical protein